MKIILRKEVASLGAVGDVVEVAGGYARNYLIPQMLAMKSTPLNIKEVEIDKERQKTASLKRREKAEQLAEQIEKISCTIPVKVGESERLFGSVTGKDILKQLKEEGFGVSRKQIVLEKHIKELGVYKVPIKLDSDVVASLKVWVVKA